MNTLFASSFQYHSLPFGWVNMLYVFFIWNDTTSVSFQSFHFPSWYARGLRIFKRMCTRITLFSGSNFLPSAHQSSRIEQSHLHLKHQPHVLVHFVKSIRAYNVKSFSTLFSDNIQWNFEIPFPCARFKSLLGYNLITKSSYHQKWDVQAPILRNWKNTLSY